MISRIITGITKQQHPKPADLKIICHVLAVLYDHVDRREDCKGDFFFVPISTRGREFLQQNYDGPEVLRVSADSVDAVHQCALNAGLWVQDSRHTVCDGLAVASGPDNSEELAAQVPLLNEWTAPENNAFDGL